MSASNEEKELACRLSIVKQFNHLLKIQAEIECEWESTQSSIEWKREANRENERSLQEDHQRESPKKRSQAGRIADWFAFKMAMNHTTCMRDLTSVSHDSKSMAMRGFCWHPHDYPMDIHQDHPC